MPPGLERGFGEAVFPLAGYRDFVSGLSDPVFSVFSLQS